MLLHVTRTLPCSHDVPVLRAPSDLCCVSLRRPRRERSPKALRAHPDDVLASLAEQSRQTPTVRGAPQHWQQDLNPGSKGPSIDSSDTNLASSAAAVQSNSSYIVVLPSRKIRPSTMDFDVMLTQLAAWKQQYLSAHVPRFCFDAPELGAWVRFVRKQHKDGKLEQWKVDRLNELTFEWELTDQDAKWHHIYHQLRRYQLLYGSTVVDVSHSARDGCDWMLVAQWLKRQGRLLAKRKLSGQKKAMLAQLGVTLYLPQRLLHRTAQLQALNGPERRKLRKKWKKLDMEAAEKHWQQQQLQQEQQQEQELLQQQVDKKRLLLLLDAQQQHRAVSTAAGDDAFVLAVSSSSSSLLGQAIEQQQQQVLAAGVLQQHGQMQHEPVVIGDKPVHLQQQQRQQQQQPLDLLEGTDIDTAAVTPGSSLQSTDDQQWWQQDSRDGSATADNNAADQPLSSATGAEAAQAQVGLQDQQQQQQLQDRQQQQQQPALALLSPAELPQPQPTSAPAGDVPTVTSSEVQVVQGEKQRALFYQRNRRPWKRRLHSRHEKWLQLEQPLGL